MQDVVGYRAIRMVSYGVLVLMGGAVCYAIYIAVKYWSGIGV